MKYIIDRKAIGPYKCVRGKCGFSILDESKVVEIPKDVTSDIIQQLNALGKANEAAKGFSEFFKEGQKQDSKAFVIPRIELELKRMGIDTTKLEVFVAGLENN